MTRRLTIIAVAGAVLVSFGLYQTELRVREMDKELAELNTARLEHERNIQVLEAEWSYLNRPERLQRLSERYLLLVPPAIERMGDPRQLATLPQRPQALAKRPDDNSEAAADGWPSVGDALPLPAWKPAVTATPVALTTRGGGDG